MRRKGFTLVELLIVIAILGALSSMMMISSTDAVISARVNNVIGNLRSLKTATLSHYIKSMDSYADDGKVTGDTKKFAFKELGVKQENSFASYDIKGTTTTWYVQYTGPITKDEEAKFIAAAKKAGLNTGEADDLYATDGKTVGLKVKD